MARLHFYMNWIAGICILVSNKYGRIVIWMDCLIGAIVSAPKANMSLSSSLLVHLSLKPTILSQSADIAMDKS